MICKFCGTETGDSAFCVNCGGRMDKSDVGSQPNNIPPAGGYMPPQGGFVPPVGSNTNPNGAPPPQNTYYGTPQQPQAGQPQNSYYTPQGQQPPLKQSTQPDKLGCGFTLLCFLIPIAGIILFAVWHNTRPAAAKNALILGIVMIVLGIIAGVLYYFVFFAAIMAGMGTAGGGGYYALSTLASILL